MRLSIAMGTLRWLLMAGFAVGAVAAQAAGGFTITQNEETRVAVGMSENEVQQTFGRPAHIHRYPGMPGSTWTYQVQAAPFGKTDFNVDFDSDGKVVAAGEQIFGDR